MAIGTKARRGPTGPRTPIGKASSSRNATKHSIFATKDEEQQAAQADLFRRITKEVSDTGATVVEFLRQLSHNLVEREKIEQYFDAETWKAHLAEERAVLEAGIAPKHTMFHVTDFTTHMPGVEVPRVKAVVAVKLLEALKTCIEHRGLRPKEDVQMLHGIYGDSPTGLGKVLLNLCTSDEKQKSDVAQHENGVAPQEDATVGVINYLKMEIEVMKNLVNLEDVFWHEQQHSKIHALPPDPVLERVAKYRAANSRECGRILENLGLFLGLKIACKK